VRSGRTGNESQSDVMNALDLAVKSRAEIPEMLAALSTGTLTRAEYEGSLSRLAELEAKVEALVASAAAQVPDEAPASEAASKKRGK
jgi:hypothetical protein